MKYLILFAILLSFATAAHAITDCSIGCDVNGGTLVDINFVFANWSSGTSDASITIRDVNNHAVALKDTTTVSSWGTTQNITYWADKDGNYTLAVFSQGTVNDFNINIAFTSNGSPATFFDVNCAGTSCGGSTQTYKFKVSASPTLIFDDNKTFTPNVKANNPMSATFQFRDGHGPGNGGGICGAIGSCDTALRIRHFPDGNILAHFSNTNWAGGPFTITWTPEYDGNYYIEPWYQGLWGQYDLNTSYTNDSNTPTLLSDKYQHIGAGLDTGNFTQYFFNVVQSQPIVFSDGATNIPPVKGNTFVTVSVKYNTTSCTNCEASIAVRRVSDNNIVAFKSTLGSTTTWTTQWYANYDGQYQLEIRNPTEWGNYDVNISYTDNTGTSRFFSDKFRNAGSGLATGQTVQYPFTVTGSAPVLLDDKLKLPLKAKAGTTFTAKIRYRDGHGPGYGAGICGALGACDTQLRIKKVSDGNVMASISSANFNSWTGTPVTLSWTVVGNDSFYVESWYQGMWGVYDLNVDYTDTVGITRHYEDQYQHIGAGTSTGNFIEYYFDSGLSCGNGILCANPVCKPVVLNGDTNSIIDIVFSGSGFPDQNKFRSAIEFLADFNSTGDGLFSYEPFKFNKNKFNIWMVDQYKTYQAIPKGPYWKFDNPLIGDSIQKDAILNCPHGNEFVSLSVTPRFRAISANTIITGTPTGYGGHFAQLTVGCEILGTCPYPVDANYSNPYTSYCDGNATVFKTFANPTVGCDNVADSPESLQRLLVHEFGHSFGGLADEYQTSSDTGISSGSAPNCDDSPVCSKWSSFSNIDCNAICMYSDWKRPYGKSIMLEHRLQHYDYGGVSEAELERDINSYSESPAAAFFTFFTGVSFQNGEFLSGGVSLLNGSSPMLTSQPSLYKVKLLTSDGNILFDSNFLVPTTEIYEPSGFIFDENGNQVSLPDVNTIATFTDVNFYLPLPYFSNAKEIRIYENAVLKLTIDLAPDQLQFSIGYGGGAISSSNYKVDYTLTQQPTGVLTSTNYKVKLGQVYQHE